MVFIHFYYYWSQHLPKINHLSATLLLSNESPAVMVAAPTINKYCSNMITVLTASVVMMKCHSSFDNDIHTIQQNSDATRQPEFLTS